MMDVRGKKERTQQRTHLYIYVFIVCYCLSHMVCAPHLLVTGCSMKLWLLLETECLMKHADDLVTADGKKQFIFLCHI